jgi:hypothetical protein
MRNRFAKLALALTLLPALGAGFAQANTEIVGNLVMNVSANLSPSKLPREGRAPVAVSIAWKVTTVDGAEPPPLKKLQIEINRNGILDPTGLPICRYAKIQPASTSRALKNCRASLVGRGTFAAIVGLEGQEHTLTSGRMVIFNSERGGKPVLYGQIYSGYPFAHSFVIVFKVDKHRHGAYGTTLTAALPASLRAWGNLTEIKMRLSRKYGYQGERRSFLSANCPTPKGIGIASFDLARTSFAFVDGQKVSSTLSDSCKVRR